MWAASCQTLAIHACWTISGKYFSSYSLSGLALTAWSGSFPLASALALLPGSTRPCPCSGSGSQASSAGPVQDRPALCGVSLLALLSTLDVCLLSLTPGACSSPHTSALLLLQPSHAPPTDTLVCPVYPLSCASSPSPSPPRCSPPTSQNIPA